MTRALFAIAVMAGMAVSVAGQSTAGKAEDDVRAAEKAFNDSRVRADIATLDRLLMDDWTVTHGDGSIDAKSKYLADLRSRARTLEYVNDEGATVRFYGDTAVVAGLTESKGQVTTASRRAGSCGSRASTSGAMDAGRWWSRMRRDGSEPALGLVDIAPAGQRRGSFAMAFEGCGCRAAFHVGVSEWFAERDLVPDAVAGASSGSLVAAAVAIGRVNDLRPVWAELLGTRVYDPRRLLRGRWPFRMSEIVGGAATRYFGGRLLADTLMPLSIVITQLRASGFARRALTARDQIPLARAVLASCFLPGPYSRMVPIHRRLTFDGAWLARVPIDAAAALGPQKVIACVSDDRGRLLRGALWTSPMAVPDGVDCRVLSPSAPLPIGAFDFDRVATLETFAIGRESARLFVERHREWLGIDRATMAAVPR